MSDLPPVGLGGRRARARRWRPARCGCSGRWPRRSAARPSGRRSCSAAATRELADQAATVLGGLRGGAMKIGQLASFVDVDLLPAEHRDVWQERLAELRDAAPAMPWPRVRDVLEREWGRPVGSVLASVDETVAAAASIGQVHRAVLHDGPAVALKVQYPEIADALEADLGTAAILLRLGKAVAPGFDPAAVAGELRERILEEVDFELSTRRVLVAEWVEGERFAAVRARDREERDRFGEILFRFAYGSLSRVGAYNTDVHPGNYLLAPDGAVVFLDFGSVKEHDQARGRLGVGVPLAAARGDGEALVEGLRALGYLRRADATTAERWLAQTRAVNGWLLEDREVTIDRELVAGIIGRLAAPDGAVAFSREVAVPTEEVMFRRLEVGVLAVLGQLGATGNWHAICREWWFGDAARTELGEADQAFWRARGRDEPLFAPD